jgi:hypothetical protein
MVDSGMIAALEAVMVEEKKAVKNLDTELERALREPGRNGKERRLKGG